MQLSNKTLEKLRIIINNNGTPDCGKYNKNSGGQN